MINLVSLRLVFIFCELTWPEFELRSPERQTAAGSGSQDLEIPFGGSRTGFSQCSGRIDRPQVHHEVEASHRAVKVTEKLLK